MGCDIHIYTEAKKHIDGQERWCNVDNWRLNPYFGQYEDETEYSQKSLYSHRNYDLFAHLAGVRNYGEVNSADFDRGIPEDVSTVVRKAFEAWGCDAHTPGWCTLAELKEASRNAPTTTRQGYVAKAEAQKFKESGTLPTMFAQGVSDEDNYEWLKWEMECHCFDDLIESLDERKRDEFWIFNEENDDNSMDDKIRIVFWFDN